MSSTSQPKDFSDLYTDFMNRVRADTSATAVATIAKRYINIALKDMHLGFSEKVPWAERRATLLTQPSYTTGTVTITQGSSTLTGSSTAWTTNNAWGVNNARATGRIKIAGDYEVYTISSVGGATTITLNEKFVGDDVSAASYTYFEDEYALASDFLRPVDVQSFTEDRSIPLIGRTEFRARWPRNSTPNKPQVATLIDLPPSGNTTPIRYVKLAPPPSDALLLPYTYVTNLLATSSSGTGQTDLSGDTDEPIVPYGYRHAIIFHALYHWYRDRSDDQRSQEARAEYVDIMARIMGATEIGAPKPQIRPRISSYVRHARSPWRGGTGRYTTGTRFDEMR